MVEVKVSGIALDSISNQPVVFLQEVDGTRILPIWIGHNEALAIGMVLEKKSPERPLTHDLMKTLIQGLDAKVSRVVVNDIRNNTYYARIYLEKDNAIVEVDARPSDSIALALRTAAPLYVADEVFKEAQTFSIEKGKTLRDRLRNLKPEDFGKYEI